MQSREYMSRILVIDGDLSTLAMFETCLTREGYEASTASTGTDGLNRYVEPSPDVVILDILLPDIDGLTVLEELLEENENARVIMMAVQPDMETTIRAMKMGAFDYISKPVDMTELFMTIRKALSAIEMDRKMGGLPAKPSPEHKAGDIVGSGREMREIFKLVGVVSQSRTTVLIEGESGTGKELIAKVIHNHTSPNEPFIAVNCSAIVETLLESELFGHEKGSFTSAFSRQLGKFELARYGTLFLDEVTDMPFTVQSKLLRAIETKKITAVGSSKETPYNSRIISATSQDIRAQLADNQFRLDLFHRLNTIEIIIPPLRERQDDIEPLLAHFVKQYATELNKAIPSIDKSLLEMLHGYSFPGNVRELKNIVERMYILSNKIRWDAQLLCEINPFSFTNEGFGSIPDYDEEDAIVKALIKARGKQKDAALLLNVSEATLSRRIIKYNLQQHTRKNK